MSEEILTITEGGNVFKYDPDYELYEGKIIIENKWITVALAPESGTTDASESLKTFKKIKNDFKNFYHKVLSQCSKKLVELANDWREDNDMHEITEEEIYKRIDSNFFEMEIDENDFSVYLNDDDLFWGHVILCEGDIEDDDFYVTIAG